MTCDLFCCYGRREKKPLKKSGRVPFHAVKATPPKPQLKRDQSNSPQTRDEQLRGCVCSQELKTTAGVLTALAGITLIASSGGVAAPIVTGAITTSAGVIQVVDAQMAP